MTKFIQAVGACVVVIGTIFLVSVIAAFPIMWIANYVFAPHALAVVFGVTTLGFWKAYWFSTFAGFIFKSTNPSVSK